MGKLLCRPCRPSFTDSNIQSSMMDDQLDYYSDQNIRDGFKIDETSQRYNNDKVLIKKYIASHLVIEEEKNSFFNQSILDSYISYGKPRKLSQQIGRLERNDSRQDSTKDMLSPQNQMLISQNIRDSTSLNNDQLINNYYSQNQNFKIGKEVLYNTPIIIKHVRTFMQLHSHYLNYEYGSKQQEVCTSQYNLDNSAEEYDIWIIQPISSVNQPEQIKSEDYVFIQHQLTKKYLTTQRKHLSQKSKIYQQIYMQDKRIILGEDIDQFLWKIHILKNGPDDFLHINSIITLTHKITLCSLHSHNIKAIQPNQLEVVGCHGRDWGDLWVIEEIQNQQQVEPPAQPQNKNNKADSTEIYKF